MYRSEVQWIADRCRTQPVDGMRGRHFARTNRRRKAHQVVPPALDRFGAHLHHPAAGLHQAGADGGQPTSSAGHLTGSKRGEPARSQAVLHSSIDLSPARRCVPSDSGLQPVREYDSDRQLRGVEFRAACVADGSGLANRVGVCEVLEPSSELRMPYSRHLASAVPATRSRSPRTAAGAHFYWPSSAQRAARCDSESGIFDLPTDGLASTYACDPLFGWGRP